MTLIYGSMSHTYSGRKKKKLPRGRKAKAVFKPLVSVKPYVRSTPDYPSVESTRSNCGLKDESYKREVSQNYTIAPAYNKGAYQVISKQNVRDIGR